MAFLNCSSHDIQGGHFHFSFQSKIFQYNFGGPNTTFSMEFLPSSLMDVLKNQVASLLLVFM